ncbi:unnamed protein product [Prunus armeniaca]
MTSSIEVKGSWTTTEDVLLCDCWVQVGHYLITGNEMKFSHMWRKIHAKFCGRLGLARTTVGQFFYCPYIQSMLPIMPRKPWALSFCRSLWRSLGIGLRRCAKR